MGTLEFALGETTKTVTIFHANDNVDELDEDYFIELSNPVGADFGGDNQSLRATGWVLDDDGPGNNRTLSVSSPTVVERSGAEAVFNVSLSRAFTADTTLDFSTFESSALAGDDYTARSGEVLFRAGETEASVTVGIRNDNSAEAAETFGLAVSGGGGVIGASGTATILDTDGALPVVSVEGGRALENAAATFTIRLAEPATDAVTVDYRTLSGAALNGTDYFFASGRSPLTGTIEFGVGETTKTVTIFHANDNVDELDENYTLELFNPTGLTFGAGNRTLRATGWVLDDDGPFINRVVSVSSPTVVEPTAGGSAVAVFEIELSQAAPDRLEFEFETIDGSARDRRDYRPAEGEVVFEAGQTRASVSIELLPDSRLEAGETFSLRLEPPFPAAISGNLLSATGVATISDGSFVGTARDDRLSGTAGADALVGLGGDDLYIVNHRGDRIYEERGGGDDAVRSSASHKLRKHVETLVLVGDDSIDGTGSKFDNVIRGNDRGNVLDGGKGDDRLFGNGGKDELIGGRGTDVMTGGGGADSFVFLSESDSRPGRRSDVIRKFSTQGRDRPVGDRRQRGSFREPALRVHRPVGIQRRGGRASVPQGPARGGHRRRRQGGFRRPAR